MDSMAVPEPNDWAQHLPKLPRLARPMHVALPCCGIDGSGWALKAMKANFCCNNVYDLEARYTQYLEKYMTEGSAAQLHLGPSEGNVLQTDISTWERPTHVLLAGPPCPPWAGNGCHRGERDERATVFLHIVKVVGALAKCGELQAACLENVKGILHKGKDQKDSFMQRLVTTLRSEIPEFLWDVSVLKARDYCLAQDRTRVFLRGIRSSLCPAGEVPPVLPPFGQRDLKEFLAPGLPPVDRKALTKCMQKNLQDAQEQLRQLHAEGQLSMDDVVCYPLDRADEKTYKRQVCQNRTPTLLTGNSYLFIYDVNVDAPDAQRQWFRFLLPEERFTLQGFPSEISSSFRSTALKVKAAGNAYPVPLIGAAVAGLLQKITSLPDTQEPLEDPKRLCEQLEEVMYGSGNNKTAPSKTSKMKRPASGSMMAKENPASSSTAKPAPSKREIKKKPRSSFKKLEKHNEEKKDAGNPAEEGLKRPALQAQSSKQAPKRSRTSAWRFRGFWTSSSDSS